MLWKKKRKIEYNKDLAMKMAVCADQALLYGGDEDTHDKNIMAIAEIAKLNERIAELEKEVGRKS